MLVIIKIAIAVEFSALVAGQNCQCKTSFKKDVCDILLGKSHLPSHPLEIVLGSNVLVA